MSLLNYTYLEKSCLIRFGDHGHLQHSKSSAIRPKVKGEGEGGAVIYMKKEMEPPNMIWRPSSALVACPASRTHHRHHHHGVTVIVRAVLSAYWMCILTVKYRQPAWCMCQTTDCYVSSILQQTRPPQRTCQSRL